jgi:hypothetical protein
MSGCGHSMSIRACAVGCTRAGTRTSRLSCTGRAASACRPGCKACQPMSYICVVRRTDLLKEDATWCLSGHRLPSGQWPCMYALHDGRLGSRPKRYSRRKKSLKLKLYVARPVFSSSWVAGAVGFCTSAIADATMLSRWRKHQDAPICYEEPGRSAQG